MKKEYKSPLIRVKVSCTYISVCERNGMGMCKVTFK